MQPPKHVCLYEERATSSVSVGLAVWAGERLESDVQVSAGLGEREAGWPWVTLVSTNVKSNALGG